MKWEARYKMATSSITANFCTDDPKAANAIVSALFTDVPATVPMRHKGLFDIMSVKDACLS